MIASPRRRRTAANSPSEVGRSTIGLALVSLGLALAVPEVCDDPEGAPLQQRELLAKREGRVTTGLLHPAHDQNAGHARYEDQRVADAGQCRAVDDDYVEPGLELVEQQ